MTRLEELTLRLADDVLSNAEERELRALLAESEQARQTHVYLLQIEAGLRAQREYAELPQLVMARLHGERTDSMARGVMAQIKTQPAPHFRRKQIFRRGTAGSRGGILPFPLNDRRGAATWLPLAACFVLLAGIALWLFGFTMGEPVLSEVTGPNVSMERDGKWFAPATGTNLREGDLLITPEGSTAVISFDPEKTSLTLLPGTEIKLTALSRGKRFDLLMGKLEASVARQRPFCPMILKTPWAEARVIGTRFTLTVKTNSTRLDVTEGLVRFTRTTDGQFVLVGADHFAVAAANYELAELPFTGSILRECWTNVPGGYFVTYLTSSTNYPDHPSDRDYLTNFESSSYRGTNYGARIRGYLLPPATGDYTFWINAGDGGDLFLSSDDNPNHRQEVAHWEGPRAGTEHSAPMPLKAGGKYYVEVLQKTGTTNSHLAVEWWGPGRNREVIPGEFLAPWKLK